MSLFEYVCSLVHSPGLPVRLSSMLFGHGQIYDPTKGSIFEKKH